MNNFYILPETSKKVVVEQTALERGLSKQIIEKDLWVSTLLEIIFSLPFADKLVFKGGTSLSKVWGVIDRFSEDIDLAVDRGLFGLEGDLTIRQLKEFRKVSSLFVSNELCEELKNAVKQYGLVVTSPLRRSQMAKVIRLIRNLNKSLSNTNRCLILNYHTLSRKLFLK